MNNSFEVNVLLNIEKLLDMYAMSNLDLIKTNSS